MGAADDLAKAMLDAIGGNDDVQEVPGWLDTGYPPLNKVIGGAYDKGLPYGRIIEVYGGSSSGKTAFATKMMARAQQSAGVAGFCDHEKTFQMPFAKRSGLNDQFPFWIYKRPETWEESNTLAMKAAQAIRARNLIPKEAPIVWTFDSIAAMIPKSVFYDKDGNKRGIDELTMNDTTALARVASTTIKSVNAITNDLNVCMLYLNQIRTKPGVLHGDPTTTPGGVAMEFYASCRLRTSRSMIKDKATGEMLGQATTFKCVKNKIARPFLECDIRMMFDDDGMTKFDYTTSLLEYMRDNKYIELAGNMFVWEGKKYYLKSLAEIIDKEGLYPKLCGMLPK